MFQLCGETGESLARTLMDSGAESAPRFPEKQLEMVSASPGLVSRQRLARALRSFTHQSAPRFSCRPWRGSGAWASWALRCCSTLSTFTPSSTSTSSVPSLRECEHTESMRLKLLRNDLCFTLVWSISLAYTFLLTQFFKAMACAPIRPSNSSPTHQGLRTKPLHKNHVHWHLFFDRESSSTVPSEFRTHASPPNRDLDMSR